MDSHNQTQTTSKKTIFGLPKYVILIVIFILVSTLLTVGFFIFRYYNNHLSNNINHCGNISDGSALHNDLLMRQVNSEIKKMDLDYVTHTSVNGYSQLSLHEDFYDDFSELQNKIYNRIINENEARFGKSDAEISCFNKSFLNCSDAEVKINNVITARISHSEDTCMIQIERPEKLGLACTFPSHIYEMVSNFQDITVPMSDMLNDFYTFFGPENLRSSNSTLEEVLDLIKEENDGYFDLSQAQLNITIPNNEVICNYYKKDKNH